MSSFIVELNCRTAIEAISGSFYIPCQASGDVIEEIHHLPSRLENCSFKFVRQEGNKATDWVASHKKSGRLLLDWRFNFPPDFAADMLLVGI